MQAVPEADGAADFVDVVTLHEPARRALERGRARVRAGRPHLMALIGEEGVGKSHILWWLRRQVSIAPGIFVSMAALPDLGQPFRHSLRQLVSTLCRKDPASAATPSFERPIDRLLWEGLYAQTLDLLDAARIGIYQAPAALLKLLGSLCMEGGRRRDLADFVATAQPVWQQVEPGLRAYLLSLPTEMSIDSAARAVLVQYPYPDRRALCTAWLAGEELGQKERERIGAKQVINNESAARYVLCALCRLVTAPPVNGKGPGSMLTLAYDQTDMVAQQLGLPGVQAVAEIIAAVQTQGGATLQVVSCRPETWKLLLEKPTRPGPGQLKNVDDALKLERPDVKQLQEVVKARVGQSSVLLASDLDPASWPKEVATPRAALAHLAGLWATRRKESVPLPASDMPTAKGMPSTPLRAPAPSARNAPSKPGPLAVSAKNAISKPGVAPLAAKSAANRPSSVPMGAKSGPVKAGGKSAPSTPPSAKNPVVESAPAPSASSPSITWMAMASDEELPSIKATEPAAKNRPSQAKSSPPIKSPSKPAAKPAPQPQPMPAPDPSAQSPSISWLAMASDEDPLAQAMAASAAKDGNTPGGGVSRQPRTTKERMRAVSSPQAASLRPEQVLTALGTRSRVEEWLLAQELGVSTEVLAEALIKLEDQGAIRLLPLGDGQRVVARI